MRNWVGFCARSAPKLTRQPFSTTDANPRVTSKFVGKILNLTTVTRVATEVGLSHDTDQRRAQVEQEFIGWGETTRIAKEFNLSRKSIYRHAEMLQLYPKRRRNVKAALERMIEKAESVDVTASAIVAAVQALAKINANGEWVDRVEHVDLSTVFDRMSREELEIYARENKLPTWVDDFLGGTRVQAIEEVTGG